MKKREIYNQNYNIYVAGLPRSLKLWVRDGGLKGGSLACGIQWNLREKSSPVGGLI